MKRRDVLGDLLNESAPVVGAPTPQLRTDLGRMSRDAEQEVRPARPRRSAKIGLAAAVTTLLVAGGGVAVAGGLYSWATWLQEPDNTVSFTLPSGRECEARYVVTSIDATTTQGVTEGPGINAEVREWLARTDLLDVIDLAAARAEADVIAANQPNQTVVIGADGWLEDVGASPDTRTADDDAAFVMDRAIRAAMRAHMVDAGVDVDSWSSDGGVQCAAVAR